MQEQSTSKNGVPASTSVSADALGDVTATAQGTPKKMQVPTTGETGANAAKPSAPQPEAPKPAAPQPETPKPAVPQPEAPKPTGPKPAAPKPAPAKPVPAKPAPATPVPAKPAAPKPTTQGNNRTKDTPSPTNSPAKTERFIATPRQQTATAGETAKAAIPRAAAAKGSETADKPAGTVRTPEPGAKQTPSEQSPAPKTGQGHTPATTVDEQKSRPLTPPASGAPGRAPHPAPLNDPNPAQKPDVAITPAPAEQPTKNSASSGSVDVSSSDAAATTKTADKPKTKNAAVSWPSDTARAIDVNEQTTVAADTTATAAVPAAAPVPEEDADALDATVGDGSSEPESDQKPKSEPDLAGVRPSVEAVSGTNEAPAEPSESAGPAPEGRGGAMVALMVVSFIIEVALFGAFGIWGLTTLEFSPVVSVLIAVVPVVLFWVIFMSPKAALRLPQPYHGAVAHLLFATGAALLAIAGQPQLAIAMGVLTAISLALTVAVGGRSVTNTKKSTGRRAAR